MRCPYCAEGIRDEAVICGFCRRDLVLFRALNERLTKVEDNVAELHSLLADSVSRPNYPGQDLPLRRPTLSEAARALLLSVCREQDSVLAFSERSTLFRRLVAQTWLSLAMAVTKPLCASRPNCGACELFRNVYFGPPL